MKRILSLLLVMALMLVFAACGHKPAAEEPKTEENSGNSLWGELAKEEYYDNVTVVVDATFISGYEYAEEENISTLKLNGDDVSIDGVWMDDRQAAESARATFMSVPLAVFAENESFAADEATNTYLHRGEIKYAIDFMSYQADITIRNIVITLDGSNELSKITCEMDQEFTSEGEQMKYVLNVEFTYSDFGSTVVEK